MSHRCSHLGYYQHTEDRHAGSSWPWCWRGSWQAAAGSCCPDGGGECQSRSTGGPVSQSQLLYLLPLILSSLSSLSTFLFSWKVHAPTYTSTHGRIQIPVQTFDIPRHAHTCTHAHVHARACAHTHTHTHIHTQNEHIQQTHTNTYKHAHIQIHHTKPGISNNSPAASCQGWPPHLAPCGLERKQSAPPLQSSSWGCGSEPCGPRGSGGILRGARSDRWKQQKGWVHGNTPVECPPNITMVVAHEGALNSFLMTIGKFSVMIGTLLYILGSCEHHFLLPLLRFPARSLGVHHFGWDFCICDRF